MVVAVALIAILTASITSTFVEAAQRRHRAGEEAQDRHEAEALRKQLDDVIARLAGSRPGWTDGTSDAGWNHETRRPEGPTGLA